MSHDYRGVQWTPFKVKYDRLVLMGIGLYLSAFIVVSSVFTPLEESFAPIQLLIRATGTLSFGLLTFILTIGPLARLTPRFKPFLYNRRHLGVTTFLIALIHGGLVLLWYHGFSNVNPLVSLFVSNPRYGSLAGFPFESLGFVALMIMFLMAATSHDFWNANLGPAVWKTIHMGVYLAYGLLVAHVALGAIQFEKDPAYVVILSAGAALVAGLHITTGIIGVRYRGAAGPDGWLNVAAFDDIENNRAKIVQPDTGEAIAVFRHGDEISAVSNVCRHQGGPLGEGKIV
ncbi:MAG: ferric reductase-like transmembrane domain-containing protein, partial [Pseudomonadota bacterium]